MHEQVMLCHAPRVMLAGPYIRNLWFDRMLLNSDQHANAAWPWEEVYHTNYIYTSDVLKLPSPAGTDGPRVFGCQGVLVHNEEPPA